MPGNNRLHVVLPSGISGRDDLTSATKLILGWLLARKGDNWSVWWQQEKIVDELRVDRKTVYNSLTTLEEKDLVYVVPHEYDARRNHIVFTEDKSYHWSDGDIAAMRTEIERRHLHRPDSTTAGKNSLRGKVPHENYGESFPASGGQNGGEIPQNASFDYIYEKNSQRKENPACVNLAIPSVATNGSRDLDISFSPKENQTNTTNLKGNQAIREAKPYATSNISEPEGFTDPVTLSPLPPTPLPAAAPLTGYEDESWEPQLGFSRWNRTKGLPKLNAEAKRWIEHVHEQGVGDIPWSTVEAALEAFVANDEMKGRSYPYRAFWKNPAAWAPNRQESRQNAPGRFQGVRTPTPPPSAAPCPASASAVAPYVEMWNRDNPHSETDATIANSWDWKECIGVELFRKEFSRIAQWCGFLRDDCGLTHVNLPWVLRKQHGVKKRNWERLIEGDFLPTGWSRYPQTREDADAQKRDSDEVFRDLASKKLPPRTPEEIEISRQKDIERKAKLLAWMAECRAKTEAKRQAELRAVINSPDYDPFAAIAGIDAA